MKFNRPEPRNCVQRNNKIVLKNIRMALIGLLHFVRGNKPLDFFAKTLILVACPIEVAEF
jgi:hypothetical protein